MNEYFSFIPAILLGVLTVFCLSNIFDKQDEIIGRFWKLLIGIVLFAFTVHMTNLGIEELNKAKRNEINKYNSLY